MAEDYREKLEELVLHEPLDQAVHLIGVDLLEHLTAIQTHVELVSMRFPETDEAIQEIVVMLRSLNQSVHSLLRGALMSRLQQHDPE